MSKDQETKGIVVVHVYSCIKGFYTSDIIELLKQYEIWEANAKEYLVACKESCCSCKKLAIQSQWLKKIMLNCGQLLSL